VAILAGRANGTLVIANPTLFPMTYVLEAQSFAVLPSGDVVFSRLDTTRVRLRLAAMSGRIPPRQSMRVFYEAFADSLPSWFAIIATFSKGAPGAGLTMRLQMSQTVYLMQKAEALATDLEFGALTFDPLTRIVRARVENHSAKLTRLTALTLVASTGQKIAVEAGPIFPMSVREFSFAWTYAGTPVSGVADFGKFALTEPIATAARDAPARSAP
jgi:hypothetical protein